MKSHQLLSLYKNTNFSLKTQLTPNAYKDQVTGITKKSQ